MKLNLPTLLVLTVIFLGGCKRSPAPPANAPAPKKVAYVTTGVDPFWDICAGGARQAEKDLGIPCEVHMPKTGLIEQKRILDALLAKGIAGIAISPMDADVQTPDFNAAAKRTKLITHDDDAPESARLCFIGTDNYKTGRAIGTLVKEALPQGGEVILFVGRLDRPNVRLRRQGTIDELLDRPAQTSTDVKFDPVSGSIKGGRFTVLGTSTDDFDKARAKSNAKDAIARHANLSCMVGLMAYNSPACLDAVKAAGKLDKIKIISFAEQDAALQGIKDGTVHGTVSQQPWKYGYESVRMLKQILDGNSKVIPKNKFLEIPCVIVTKANIDEFWMQKKKMETLGKKP
jgi:ribose transport system substrate-binding protein